MALAIDVPVDDLCSFCEYLSGRHPYTIVTRDERVAMLVTHEQRGTPHVLVIPVAHRPTILDVADDELEALMRLIRLAARAIEAVWKRPGIAVWQNNGVPASQHVPHVHFHVAGTLDEGGTNWGKVPRLSQAETDAIAEKIRGGLALLD
jgi:histidine triad (HIT) family protein